MATLTELQTHTSRAHGCRLLGLNRASSYRWSQPPMIGLRRPRGGGTQPAALTPTETAEVLAVLTSARFCDKTPAQVWAALLDEGRYLCSQATMYRILRANKMTTQRRRHATHPPKTIPELHATGPNQVWAWDITKLRGPVKGIWYSAYVMIDIFSRKIIHAEVHPHERELLARDFIHTCTTTNPEAKPSWIHSDNGIPMVGKPVTQLLADLDITASRSRPHTSNDNPHIEAWNKTLKYAPVFPDRFTTLTHARQFLTDFVTYYNQHHHHSALGWHTPNTVHDGTWTTINQQRQHTLHHAHTTHPERFTRPPQAPTPPDHAWINQPTQTHAHQNT